MMVRLRGADELDRFVFGGGPRASGLSICWVGSLSNSAYIGNGPTYFIETRLGGGGYSQAVLLFSQI